MEAKIQQVQMFKDKKGKLRAIQLDGREVAEKIWGGLPYETMFCYLYRRFGPPMSGSDDQKDLCRYLLTTDDEDVIVSIRLASYDFLMISPLVSEGFYMEHRMELFNCFEESEFLDEENHPALNRIYKAFARFLENMLLPVSIRDTLFNCLGERDDEDWDKEVPAFQYAGYGVQIHEGRPILYLSEE